VDAAIAPGNDEVAVVLNFAGSIGLDSSFDTAGGDDIYMARLRL
jgi:hypothetical protein